MQYPTSPGDLDFYTGGAGGADVLGPRHFRWSRTLPKVVAVAEVPTAIATVGLSRKVLMPR